MSASRTMTLPELLSGYTEYEHIPALTMTGLTLDSRHTSAGDVYLALEGTRSHGLQFAEQAQSAGAIAVLVDQHLFESDDSLLKGFDIPAVPVNDLSAVAGELASRFFGHPTRQLSVCGVTGTDGKTSVCRFISQALQRMGVVTGYIGTIGWGIGDELAPNPLTTPDPVTLQSMFATLLEQGVTAVALEVSSHALSQGRVNGVAFDVAVLTNFGRDHLDYHGTLEHYRAAKERLFFWPELRGASLNLDDSLGQHIASRYSSEIGSPEIVGYSIDGKPASASGQTGGQTGGQTSGEMISATNIVTDANGLHFDLLATALQTPVQSPLLGRFNVQNLLASYGALRLLGVAANDAILHLSALRSVPGRMEHFHTDGGVNAVVDYAHTPQALEAAIKTLRAHCKGNLTVVFGCGGDRDSGKRPLMGSVAARFADLVILTDDNPRTEESDAIIQDILQGIADRRDTRVINDRSAAISTALQDAANDDWVLIAGKGHEDYQIVGNTRHSFSDRALVAELLSNQQRISGSVGECR